MSKLFHVFRSSLPCALNSCTPLKSCSRTLYCSQIRLDQNGDDKKVTSETVNDKDCRNENVDNNEEAQQKLLSTLRSSTNDLVHKTSNIETLSPDTEIQDSEVAQGDSAEKREKTREKLNDLLRTMTKVPTEKIPDVQLPRPRVEARKKYRKMKAEFIKRKEEIEKEKIDYQIEKAASKVAEKLGGDTKRTEKELLDLYLSSSTPQEIQSPTGEMEGEKPFTNMKDLLLSLKVEKEKPDQRAQVRRANTFRRETKVVTIPSIPLSRARSKGYSKIDIFGAEPLDIFTTDEGNKKGPPVESVMWDFLQERDLKLSITKPPANIYEQLIVWTEQGKIWKFPINNEQDWEEENVDFTEHVFLEHMLEPWCPPSGLIRHFMELVCVGLSKNPYLSVKEKHAHIIFYEHYFRHKNNLLVDLGLEPIKDRPHLEQAAV